MTERELKLALPGRFTIPPLSLGGEALRVEHLADLSLRATYYDTTDLRLARSGVTLRYRTGDVGGATWTLKLPHAGNGKMMERDEIHLAGPGREPPLTARSLVTAYARGAQLVAVATLRTRRRRMRLLALEGDDEPVAELAIDEVSVVEGRRVVSRFRELEVEDLRGDVELTSLADQLREAGAIGSEPIPKVVRALGSRATAPPDVVRPQPPDGATMEDALRLAIADALLRLLQHDPQARLGDAEGVHQVRVAFRRLRSDLRTLGDCVDLAWREVIEPRLREVGAALAAMRDLDVITERLRGDVAGGPAALPVLFDELERRRTDAERELRAELDAPRYAALLDELVSAVSRPPVGPSAAAPAASRLPTLAMGAWQRLERRASRLTQHSSSEEFHRARIAVKRARYAAELAARVLPGKTAEGAARFASKLAAAQDQLGAMQDAVVAEGVVRETLDGGRRSVRYAFEAGRLVERQRRRHDEARGAFLDTWPKLRRRRLRTWAS